MRVCMWAWRSDILFLKHYSSIFKQSSNPVTWFLEEPSQFPVGQTAQSLTCSIMEKPHTGLDHCLNMLLSCFRKGMSDGGRNPSNTCNLTRKPSVLPGCQLLCIVSCVVLRAGRPSSVPGCNSRSRSTPRHTRPKLRRTDRFSNLWLQWKPDIQSCVKTFLLSFEDHS